MAPVADTSVEQRIVGYLIWTEEPVSNAGCKDLEVVLYTQRQVCPVLNSRALFFQYVAKPSAGGDAIVSKDILDQLIVATYLI